MSQLDSIISQLQKVLEEKRGGTESDVRSEVTESSVDTVAAKRALAAFLSRAPESFEGIEANGLSDPAVIEAMRKSLIAFIDSPLRNGGTALMPGTISPDHARQEDQGKSEVHGHTSPSENNTPLNPFSPSPGNEFSWTPPCKTCIERKATGETSKPGKDAAPATEIPGSISSSAAPREGSSQPLRTSGYGSVSGAVPVSGHGGDASSTLSASASGSGALSPASSSFASSAPRASAVTDTAPAPATNAKSPVQALLNVFGARSNKAQKAPEVVAPRRVTPMSDPSGLKNEEKSLPQKVAESAAPTMSAPAAETEAVVSAPVRINNTVLWFKHIQSVEAALRISDVHFATVLVALLFEVATAVEAPPNITARLKTFEARISMEFNKYQEAEEHLLLTISELDDTPFASNVTAAWCWHSLAQCYYRQGKHDQSKAAQQKAIAIATAALGAKDPETMLFHEPIV